MSHTFFPYKWIFTQSLYFCHNTLMKELPLHSSLLLFSSDKMSEGFALGQGNPFKGFDSYYYPGVAKSRTQLSN